MATRGKRFKKPSVRKWLPSYVTVTRVVKPKRGKGAFRRKSRYKPLDETV